MLKQYIEYRETQQLRKDHLNKQKQRQALIIIGVLGALLALVMFVKALSPAEPVATPATPVVSGATAAQPEQQSQAVVQDAEKFAVIVTKPLDTLTSEDLDFIDTKADDPCYADNTQLPKAEMVDAIVACSK